MGQLISIKAGDVAMEAELNDSPCAKAVAAALPLSASASTWGDEIYFAVPVECQLEEGHAETVPMGAVGYWPPGNAVCLFFGPTPMSAPGEIRPASAVNLIGALKGDPEALRRVPAGAMVELRKAGRDAH